MTYTSEVLADTPLAYYRLGETSGTTMIDSSGNGRNGTYAGSPTLGASGLLVGDSNTAITFDGSNDVGTTPAATWMDSASFSVETLFVPSLVSTGARTIVARSAASSLWILRTDAAKIGAYVVTTAFKTVASSTTLTAGTKYHAVMTYDGATLRLYVNGNLEGSIAAAGLSTNKPLLTVGANGGATPGELFTGTIDEVSYYGTALSATRVKAHYDASIIGPLSLSGVWGLVG